MAAEMECPQTAPVESRQRPLFAGTKWSAGGWALVLRRLPGRTESTKRIGAGPGAVKLTAFDAPAHLLPN